MRRLSGYGPSLIVLATAMLVLFLGPSVVRELTYKQTETRMIQASHRLDSNDVLAQINQAYQDIAAFVEPSVVHISAQQSSPDRPGVVSLSAGSGWIFDDDGHVVTNWHVVRDSDRREVQLVSGELRPAEIVGYDKSTDIAVLKIDSGLLHPARRADVRSDPVEQGDLIFAFGSPFDFRFSMSSGIVSGMGRSVDVLGRTGYENFIQVDAAINPGNSGGPLTDFRGHVIGMNTAIATGRSSNSFEEGQFAGIGLAIPLEMIEPVVEQIIENGVVNKGLLGVEPRELNVRAAQADGFIGSGVRIETVRAGGAADIAGVHAGDIVTRVNGNPVGNVAQLRSVISSMLPGEVAELSIFRFDRDRGESELLELSVKLTRLDLLRDAGELPRDQSHDRIPQLGIAKMIPSSLEAAERLGIPYRAGVILERLVPGTMLAQRVPPGSTIVSVMDYPIDDVDDFLKRLRQTNLRSGAKVRIVTPQGVSGTMWLRVEP